MENHNCIQSNTKQKSTMLSTIWVSAQVCETIKPQQPFSEKLFPGSSVLAKILEHVREWSYDKPTKCLKEKNRER